MQQQPRWAREAWIPIAAGLAWFWLGAAAGLVGFLLCLLPGFFLVGAGASKLLWPGDPRICQFAALGGIVGTVLSLPALFAVGLWSGLALLVLSVGSVFAAGLVSLRQQPLVEEVPPPIHSLGLAAKVAMDESLLATMQVTVPMPVGSRVVRIEREVEEARALYESQGWLEKPVEYHRAPPPLESPHIAPARTRGIAFEHLSFESGYEPYPDEPGRDRWLGFRPNRTAHAWVLRHDGEPRPWLICIHGYQMGWPLVDLAVFRPEWLHRRLGMNLVLPVLPLHGKRKVGRRSGDGFLAGDILDTVHAEAQAMWDMRRILGWVRAQGASRVGVYGLSLGGYNTALLSCLEQDLACAVAGIPVADFARIVTHHGPPLQIRYLEHRGFREEHMSEVLRVVAPLVLDPVAPVERRYLFGGVADRLVPPDQVRDLWLHWGRPRIAWYQGGHVTFRGDPGVRRLLDDAFRETGMSR